MAAQISENLKVPHRYVLKLPALQSKTTIHRYSSRILVTRKLLQNPSKWNALCELVRAENKKKWGPEKWIHFPLKRFILGEVIWKTLPSFFYLTCSSWIWEFRASLNFCLTMTINGIVSIFKILSLFHSLRFYRRLMALFNFISTFYIWTTKFTMELIKSVQSYVIGIEWSKS